MIKFKKNIIFNIVLFLSMASSYAWDKPKYNSSEFATFQSAEKMSSELFDEKMGNSLLFSPGLEVNTNRGSLSTKVSIPIPSNLLKLNSLNLTYNSNKRMNSGYGIGWSLDLPRIIFSGYSKFGSRLQITGSIGNSELVKVDKVPVNLNHVDSFKESSKLTFYRPSIDRTFVIIIKNEEGEYLALMPNGKTWIFNKKGQPIGLVDMYGSQLTFSWEKGVLVKVLGPASRWEVNLNYLANHSLASSFHNEMRKRPQGVKSIQIVGEGEEINVLFEYKTEYLKKAYYKGGFGNIFEGSYKLYSSTELDKISNELKASDNKTPIFLNQLDIGEEGKGADLITPEENTVYIDLNNDGKDDKIVFDFKKAKREIELYLKNVEYTVTGSSSESCHATPNASIADAKKFFRSRIYQAKTYMAHTLKGKTEYAIDNSLDIGPLGLHSNEVEVVMGVTSTKKCKNIEYFDFTPFPNKLNFLDVNGDGRRDIVYCPAISELDKKKVADGETFYSNAVLSILDLFKNKFTKEQDFNKTLNHSGKKASVYFNLPDESKVNERWSEIQNFAEKDEVENFLLNLSKWEKTDLNINCHQYSFFFDYNNDGLVDIINGKNIILMSSIGNVERVKLNDSEMKGLFEEVPDKVENSSMLIADTNTNGKLEIIKAKSLIDHPLSGIRHIYREGETSLITPSSKVELLHKVYSPFGGIKKINYSFEGGRWVIVEIETDPKSKEQSKFKKEFEYLTPKRILLLGDS
jgi:hypothetical protein